GFSVLLADHYVWIYFFYILGYDSELRCARRINLLLVAKGNRFERQDRFTGFVDRLDAFLKSSRGRSHTQLAIRIDYYLSARHRHPRNARNESAVLCALSADPDLIGLAGCSERTDIDVVTAGGEID